LGERLQRYTTKVKEENRQKLSQLEIKCNCEYFAKIFPEYYNGWGINLNKNDFEKIESIL
jgi:hypothetical protein